MLFRNLLETYIQFGFDIYNKFKQEKGGVNDFRPFNTNYTHVFGKDEYNSPRSTRVTFGLNNLYVRKKSS